MFAFRDKLRFALTPPPPPPVEKRAGPDIEPRSEFTLRCLLFLAIVAAAAFAAAPDDALAAPDVFVAA